MSRNKLILLIATAALVISAVVVFMSGKHSAVNPESGPSGEFSKSRSTSSRSNPGSVTEGPASRDPRPETERTLERINGWLADDSLPPEQAANKLWEVFSDTRQTHDVRREALAHALNLTTDKLLVSKYIPVFEQPKLWSGEIGEAALDDLYNRGKTAKLSAGAALFGHATGEFRENLRELLRFELEEPDADDATLVRLANEKLAGKPVSE